VAGRVLETTYLRLPVDDDGSPAENAADPIASALGGYDALVIGPGLGRSPGTTRLVSAVLSASTIPTVIDADALNALSELADWSTLLPSQAVITPHPGEMSRLINQPIAAIEASRIEVARRAGQGTAVVVLKGPHTIVASPDGQLRIEGHANPALASGGSGDVLSGIIGGLMAQGLSPFDAASLGVHLHAMAGRQWSETNGDAGLLASDLLTEIPLARSRLARL
jgi:NAD(P)H-hydrate epimerase